MLAGTFSSVYKAIDLKNASYDNSLWLNAQTGAVTAGDVDIASSSSHKKPKRPKVYVALKRIYVTSSPTRIENEISILEDLRFVFRTTGQPCSTIDISCFQLLLSYSSISHARCADALCLPSLGH